MAKIDVLNLKAEKVKETTLSDSIWNIEINEQVLTKSIKLNLDSLRQGTAKTKIKSEVRGGGKKPWRQKGTGRARQGSIRSPQWVGGGVVFGPTPRSYSFKMNKKEKTLALKSALTDKYKNKKLIVIDNFNLESNKTKDITKILDVLNAKNKTLIVIEKTNENLTLSTRNLKNILVISFNELNVLNIVNADKIILEESCIKRIEEVLK